MKQSVINTDQVVTFKPDHDSNSVHIY